MAQSKTSKAYWEQRQQALMAGLDKRDKSFSDKLAKDYQRQLNSIDKEIAAYYQQYGLDQTNDYRKMMIGLTDAERDNLFKNFDALAAKDPKLAAMLPNRDSIYKLNRLEGMQMSLRMHMADLGSIEESKMADYLKSSYDYGYNGTMKHLPNVPAMYHANSRVAEEMLNSKWFNDQNYSDRLWKNKDTLRNWLTQDLKDGLIRGTSYDDMSKQLAHRMSVGAFYAKRLVWTESSFMMNQGNKNAFVDDGLKYYEYSAILDGRTTPMCRELDGQRFEFKDYSPGLNAPPMHSFCRSMITPIENELKRVAGESDSTGLDDLYNQVSAAFDKTNAKEMFGAERYEQFKDSLGKINDEQLLKMYARYGDQVEFAPIAEGRAYAMLNVVHLEPSSFIGDKISTPMQTVYHEIGHAIDSQSMTNEYGLAGLKTGGTQKVRMGRRTTTVDEVARHRSGDPAYNLKNVIFDDLWNAATDGKIPSPNTLGKRPRKKSEKEAWEAKSSEIYPGYQKVNEFISDRRDAAKAHPIEYADVSDMVEGTGLYMYGGSYPWGAGHGSSYWSKSYGKQQTEFIAEYTSARAASPESLAMIQKIFPNACKVADQILNDIVGG